MYIYVLGFFFFDYVLFQNMTDDLLQWRIQDFQEVETNPIGIIMTFFLKSVKRGKSALEGVLCSHLNLNIDYKVFWTFDINFLTWI